MVVRPQEEPRVFDAFRALRKQVRPSLRKTDRGSVLLRIPRPPVGCTGALGEPAPEVPGAGKPEEQSGQGEA